MEKGEGRREKGEWKMEKGEEMEGGGKRPSSSLRTCPFRTGEAIQVRISGLLRHVCSLARKHSSQRRRGWRVGDEKMNGILILTNLKKSDRNWVSTVSKNSK